MPTVPTAENLGYNPVGALPSVQAGAGSFGGQVGQAVQGVGGALGQVSNDASAIQQRLGELQANDATNKLISGLHTITSGDPNNPQDTGYFGKQGQDAIAARQGAFKNVDDLVQSTAGSIPSPAARIQFLNEARRYVAMTQSAMDSHFQQQVNVARVDSAKASESLALQGLSIYAADDQGWNTHFQSYLSAVNNSVAARGGTADEARAALQDATEVAKAQRVQSLIGQGNLTSAQDYLKANAGDFKPATAEALNNMLTPKLRSVQAAQGAQDVLADADKQWQASTAGAAPIPAAKWAQQVQGDESGGNPNAHAPVGTASGLGQFTDGTFRSFLQATHPDMLVGATADKFQALKTDPALGTEATIWLARQNAAALSSANQPVDSTTLRLAHAVGAGGANAVLQANPQTPLAQVIGDDAVKRNPQWANLTAGDLVNQYASKYGRQPVDLSGNATPGAGFGTQPAQTQADFYKANAGALVEQARQKALAQHPDDPQFADLAASRVEQHVSAIIRQQDMAYSADRDTVLRAAIGDLAKGQHPTSVDQLTAISPQVASAWDRLTQQQPETAHQIATTLLTENARGGGDANTYGPAFYSVLNRIHADPGDPTRITDPSQVIGMVGNGLTMAGLTKAREEIVGRNTPDGEAESKMREQLFKVAHTELAGTDPVLGLKDPKGEELFLRAMPVLYKNMAALKNQGLTPQQIFDPNSPTYVGKGIAAFKRTPAQQMADMMNANGPDAAPPPQPGLVQRLLGTEPKPDLSTPEAVRAAFSSGKIQRADAIKALVGMKRPLLPAETE